MYSHVLFGVLAPSCSAGARGLPTTASQGRFAAACLLAVHQASRVHVETTVFFLQKPGK
jgi:hypothetical protein